MKKFYPLLIAIALFASAAQAKHRVGPGHELLLTGATGASALEYKTPPELGLQKKMSLGGGAGLEYHLFFNDHWALVMGLEAANYRSTVFARSIESGKHYIVDDGITPRHDEIFRFRLNSLKETQSVWALQLPVMVQWMCPLDRFANYQFYVAAGARLGYNFAGEFSRTVSKAEFMYLGDNEYNDPGSIPNWTEEIPEGFNNKKHKLDIASFNAMASIEAGIRWNLKRGVRDQLALYTGLYFDYGFINIVGKSAGEGIYTHATANKGNVWGPGESYTLAHNSILNATQPDYGAARTPGTNGPVDYVDNNKRYVKSLTTTAVGVKIKIAFATKKSNKRDTPDYTTLALPTWGPEEENLQSAHVIPEWIQNIMIEVSHSLFDYNKAELKPEVKTGLAEVIVWLKENPGTNIQIDGHTSDEGSTNHNQRLSEQRAKAVYDYFVEEGVSTRRLSHKGYGSTRPVADNSTEQGRQANRRVELTIIR